MKGILKLVAGFLIAFFFISHQSFGQNLVPDPSFEANANCTGGFTALNVWTNPDTATPDYYHRCFPNILGQGFGVPANAMGYQQPRTGDAYVGLVCYEDAPLFGCPNSIFGTNWREYAQIRLSSPLQAGQNYCVEFWVSLSNNSRYSISDMGMYFSNSSTFIQTANPLPFTPQVVNNTGQLNDTLGWTLISGSYQATGGEEYIIIGNFRGDNSTNVQCFNQNQIFPYAYYLVDDVFVGISGSCPGQCPLTAGLTASVPNCSTGLADLSVNLSGAAGPVSYLWSTGATTASLTGQPAGTYFVTVTDSSGCSATDTLVFSGANLPVFSLGNDTSICAGQSVTLTASAGSSWNWSNGATTQMVTVSPSQTTTYIATASDSVGCTWSDTLRIEVTQLPDIFIEAQGDTLFCNTDPVHTLVGGLPPGGTWSGTGVSNGAFDPVVAGPGIHWMYYSYTDQNGCTGVDSFKVEVTVCTGVQDPGLSNVQVFPNPSSGNVEIRWTNGGISDAALEIFDHLGRKIEAVITRTSRGFRVTGLPAGMYFGRLQTEEGNTTVRILSSNP